MDLYQITAYTILDRVQLQVTRCETAGELRQWSHMILEQISLPGGSSEPWDVIWAIGQELCETALRRAGNDPAARAR